MVGPDYPECAKVINIRGGTTTSDSSTDDNENDDDNNNNNIPTPPIETYLEVIHPTTDDDNITKKNEDGVLKLTSMDLQKSVTLLANPENYILVLLYNLPPTSPIPPDLTSGISPPWRCPRC